MKIGILGSGQLALMLAQEGLKHGLDVSCFCQSADDPAFAVGHSNQLGSANDPKALQDFLNSVDVCTFESEFIDCDHLSELKGSLKKFLPTVKTMRLLQDRKTQKEALDSIKIPTLPFFHSDKADWLQRAAQELKNQVVFKARRNSYDGYGTTICKNKKQVESFIKENSENCDKFIMEPLFSFKRELAVVAYRSRNGSVGFYPLVEWKAKDSKCFWVKGPAVSLHYKKVQTRIRAFLDEIDYCGVMAFEFFEGQKGLMINELAPRVHNSGHYSLNAMGLNQFATHLRCLHGENLPSKLESTTPGFAMVNLIGSGKTKCKIPTSNDGFLYWYGKKQNRKGRKMGHINALGKTPQAALKLALKGETQCQI